LIVQPSKRNGGDRHTVDKPFERRTDPQTDRHTHTHVTRLKHYPRRY